MTHDDRTARTSRRDFLKTGTSAAVAGSVAANLSLSSSVYAGGSDVLKVGLIGCGGRGSSAAGQALKADPNARLYAMADAFADRLENSYRSIKGAHGERVAVSDDRKFVGFDAYKHAVDVCDVVLLATPPHFRPEHLRYAVEKGRHVFCEKPVAVDAPGIRSVLETTERAKKKGLSLVSGLCWRYHPAVRATFEEIHNGRIGEIVAMQCSYNSNGVWGNKPRKTREQCGSEMEYQMRNWYFYTWLSGDFNVEQHVHSLDKMAWAMHDETPVEVSGTGGRIQRTDPVFGNIYDHFSVVYQYENGVKAFARCRHFRGCSVDVTDHIFGTKGTAHFASARTRIEGESPWRYRGASGSMYQIEHDELFKSIREGTPINNGYYMSMSSMMAVAGRMSAYTGKTLSWKDCLSSQKSLSPPAYEWGSLERPTVAVPGVTPFV